MAFHYVKAKEYSLDLDRLADHYKQNQFLDFDYYKEWIDGWIKVIRNTDKDTDNQIDSIKKDGLPAFEVFDMPVYLGGQEFILNFIVEGANAHIKDRNVPITKIPIRQFDSEIVWTKEKSDSSHNIDRPIIITPLPLDGPDKKIVIDGNHRISKLYEDHVPQINGYMIEPMYIVQDNILILTVDKAIYSFIMETEAIRRHLKIGKHSHELLFKSSLINNGFQKFNK